MAGSATVLTDADFAQVTSKGVTLVDFWAEWCGPCRMQGPIVEKVAEQYAGRAVVAKLDVDANRQTAEKFGIRSIPTIIVFKDGDIFRQMVALQSEDKLKSVLDEALA